MHDWTEITFLTYFKCSRYSIKFYSIDSSLQTSGLLISGLQITGLKNPVYPLDLSKQPQYILALDLDFSSTCFMYTNIVPQTKQ